MKIRRSTQHVLAATVAAAALALTACSDTEPVSETAATDGVAADVAPTTDASGPATMIPADFPLDAHLGRPPADDGEQTVQGPARDVVGARALTACGTPLSFPDGDRVDPEHELGYAVTSIEGYDGRTLQVFPSAQKAEALLEHLRSDLKGCGRDSGGDGLSDRLFATYDGETGDDSVTFGWTYEVTDGVGAPAGQLNTVARVGTAVVTVEWSSEGSAEYFAASVSRQQQLVALIAEDMCVFTDAGC
jgi:hypothetical protein